MNRQMSTFNVFFLATQQTFQMRVMVMNPFHIFLAIWIFPLIYDEMGISC